METQTERGKSVYCSEVLCLLVSVAGVCLSEFLFHPSDFREST
jgi:hypothetical protein